VCVRIRTKSIKRAKHEKGSVKHYGQKGGKNTLGIVCANNARGVPVLKNNKMFHKMAWPYFAQNCPSKRSGVFLIVRGQVEKESL
jgi:hypothetical protein